MWVWRGTKVGRRGKLKVVTIAYTLSDFCDVLGLKLIVKPSIYCANL